MAWLQARHRATADIVQVTARRPTFQARSSTGRVPSLRGTLVTSSVVSRHVSCRLLSALHHVAYCLQRTGRRHVHAPTPFSRVSHRATFPRATSSSPPPSCDAHPPTPPPVGRHRRAAGAARESTRSSPCESTRISPCEYSEYPLNPAACRPAPGAWPQLVHADPDFDTAKCSLDCVEAISDCMLLTPERKAYKPSRVWCARLRGWVWL